MSKKVNTLKEQIKERIDEAVDMEVGFTEAIYDGSKNLVGYDIFGRDSEGLVTMKLSKQKYNTTTGTYEDDESKAKFYDEVVETVFKGELEGFTGTIKVFKSVGNDGRPFALPYPVAKFVKPDKLDETNAKLDEKYVGKIVKMEYNPQFDLQIFVESPEITNNETGKTALLMKRIKTSTFDRASRRSFPDPDAIKKLPFNFEVKTKLKWNDKYLENDCSDVEGKEVNFTIKKALGNLFVDFNI